MEDPELLDAARTLRAELATLLPRPEEAPLADRVAGLIDRLEVGEPVGDELIEASMAPDMLVDADGRHIVEPGRIVDQQALAFR